ncbi:hypothetical protein LCA12A_0932 [Lacticaseibacillus casei 12A]|uniref:DUF1642 domain-containing protein n=1 Tax=Lacticaseibacillus paracasei TaxID=1597 RepID=UPI0002979F48|nr:DUF1642 domain-containing protein [Lacticaseibacillus paracasei]EKP98153.1 hypothetical protein LCA12A_0932 [Lacticaseibacillus casei 12A]
MSEEKLYAVKNDEGKYWDFGSDNGDFWTVCDNLRPTATCEKEAKQVSASFGGHVVALIEEPDKVVVSKTDALRQSWLVARYGRYNPDAVSDILARYKDEAWDMIEAYTNGYTVEKEKKYLVYKELGGKQKNKQFAQAYRSSVYPGTVSWILTNEVTNRSFAQFTESEIEHFGLQDCEKEEVTDDEQ